MDLEKKTTWELQRGNRRKDRIAVALVLALLIVGIASVLSGCNQDINDQAQVTPTAGRTQQASPTRPTRQLPTARPTQLPILPEHLIFQGDISGTLTAGINPLPLTNNDPAEGSVPTNGGYYDSAPTATQCAKFNSLYGSNPFTTPDTYIAVIVGQVGAMRYAITLEIDMNDWAYTTPGTSLSPLQSIYGLVNVYEIGGQKRLWESVFGPGMQGGSITLNPNRTSGTVNTWLATDDKAPVTNSTLHLQGNWRCG